MSPNSASGTVVEMPLLSGSTVPIAGYTESMNSASVYLLALLHIAPAAASVYHILLYKRDTRAAMGWIMACIFIPFGGPVAYLLFGINRVRSRARGMPHSPFAIDFETSRRNLADATIVTQGLPAVGQYITGQLPTKENAVSVYHNGEEAYPAMLESINKAQHRILLATYILKTDQTGLMFADALGAAVSRGVRVMALVDGFGELYSWPKPAKLLKQRGITVARFLPPRLLPPSIYLNLRNHRKILIVDQDIAYVGGMNISDHHTSVDGQARKVTDVHFGLRGGVVADLANVFYHDWQFTTGQADDDDVHPPPTSRGDAACRVIIDGPNDQMDAISLTIQGTISAAKKSVDVMTPYFLPSREMIASLQSAALRGVRVRIVLPAKNNLFYVHWANRNLLTGLLEWGIELYYQPAPFCHSKILCIDDDYCMIGSANLDPRSLRLNFELGIEIFSCELSSELHSHIDDVVVISVPISIDELANRSIPVRLRDSVASLFSPYL
jgi:cardiolipin synthase